MAARGEQQFPKKRVTKCGFYDKTLLLLHLFKHRTSNSLIDKVAARAFAF
jgi:hypothetical protein